MIHRLVIPDEGWTLPNVNKIMTSFRGGGNLGQNDVTTALARHPTKNVNKAEIAWINFDRFLIRSSFVSEQDIDLRITGRSDSGQTIDIRETTTVSSDQTQIVRIRFVFNFWSRYIYSCWNHYFYVSWKDKEVSKRLSKITPKVLKDRLQVCVEAFLLLFKVVLTTLTLTRLWAIWQNWISLVFRFKCLFTLATIKIVRLKLSLVFLYKKTHRFQEN